MPPREDTVDGPPIAGAQASDTSPTVKGLVQALVRSAGTQRAQLALLRELNRRVAELERARRGHCQSRRLSLELEALQREPKIAFGWLISPLKQAARKALGRGRYLRREYELELEHRMESSGAAATIAWVKAVVDKRDIAPDLAYPLLVAALAERNDAANAAGVAKHVADRYGNDAASASLIKRCALEQATPTPRQWEDSVLWRSSVGPRVHKLALPANRAGARAWERARSLGPLSGHPHGLTALTLGAPRLTHALGDFLQELESNPQSWRHDLQRYLPDFCVVDLSLIQTVADDERLDLEEIANICEGISCLPVLWGDEANVMKGKRRVESTIPAAVVCFADTRATADRLRNAAGANIAHVIGPVVDTRHAKLPAPRKKSALWVLGLTNASEVLSSQEIQSALPTWSVEDWSVSSTTSGPPANEATKLETSSELPVEDTREILLIVGGLLEAANEQLTFVAQSLARGVPLLVHSSGKGKVVPALAEAPIIYFEDILSLSSTIADFEKHPERLRKQSHLCARFAREHLSIETGFRRFAVHAGAPSIGHNLRRVSVLCVSNRLERARQCLEIFKAQTYPHKELIFVANGDAVEEAWLEQFFDAAAQVTLLRTNSEYSLGESLNRARAVASGELWAKLDDDDHYGANYLRDSVLALEHGEAAVTGKGTFFCYVQDQDTLYLNPQREENSYTDRFLHGGTIVADRLAVEGIEFQPVRHGTDSLFLQQCVLEGLKLYSGDRYNFAYIRYPSPTHHTYAVGLDSYLRSCRRVADGFPKSIIDA